MEGDVVTARAADGTLKVVGKLRDGAFEVQGKMLTAAQFEQLAGGKRAMRRPDGQPLFSATASASAPTTASLAAEPDIDAPLLEDENDEFCYICALGGDLICCETCPATFHTECAGLAEVPQDDWFCPACRCAKCGSGAFDPVPAPQAPPTLHTTSDYDSACAKGPSETLGRVHLSKAASPPNPFFFKAPAAAAAPGGLIPTAEDTNGAKGLGKGKPPALGGAPDSKGVTPAAPVACAFTGGVRCHYGCLTPKERTAVAAADKPWYSSDMERRRAATLAEICASGRIPAGPSAAPELRLTFQLIHAAAVAGEPGLHGEAPAYSDEQREALRRTLSAALAVLRASYRRLPDSRTGGDVLPWLLRGARFPGADFSTSLVAVLYAGATLAAAAVLRPLSGGVLEIPLLATRPELRRNGLGGLLLSRIESVARSAGFSALVTPAMAMPGWPLTPSIVPNGHPLPPPLQEAWGFALAGRQDTVAMARRRPLRLPGTVFCVKALAGVTAPPVAPALELSMAPDVDVMGLQSRKMVVFRRGGPDGPEVPMTCHPGEQLLVKPPAAKIQMKDDSDEDEVERAMAAVRREGGGRRRGRPRRDSDEHAQLMTGRGGAAAQATQNPFVTPAEIHALLMQSNQAGPGAVSEEDRMARIRHNSRINAPFAGAGVLQPLGGGAAGAQASASPFLTPAQLQAVLEGPTGAAGGGGAAAAGAQPRANHFVTNAELQALLEGPTGAGGGGGMFPGASVPQQANAQAALGQQYASLQQLHAAQHQEMAVLDAALAREHAAVAGLAAQQAQQAQHAMSAYQAQFMAAQQQQMAMMGMGQLPQGFMMTGQQAPPQFFPGQMPPQMPPPQQPPFPPYQ